MPPVSAHGPIVNPLFHVELTIDKNAHVQHLKKQLQTNESRHIMIR